jgi:hypothetical protein
VHDNSPASHKLTMSGRGVGPCSGVVWQVGYTFLPRPVSGRRGAGKTVTVARAFKQGQPSFLGPEVR